MSEPKIKRLPMGASRLHDKQGNTLSPKPRRGRSKKGQGTNGGRTHEWKFPPAYHPDGRFDADL